MSFYLPIVIIVLSNIFYHICSKSTPTSVNPFASLVVTYLVGAAVSAVLYFALNRGGDFMQELRGMNWTSLLLGVAIVGLEVGTLYMYKVGWNVSMGLLVHSSIVSVCLVILGWAVYHENITPTKLIGIGVCMVGLALVRM